MRQENRSVMLVTSYHPFLLLTSSGLRRFFGSGSSSPLPLAVSSISPSPPEMSPLDGSRIADFLFFSFRWSEKWSTAEAPLLRLQKPNGEAPDANQE